MLKKMSFAIPVLFLASCAARTETPVVAIASSTGSPAPGFIYTVADVDAMGRQTAELRNRAKHDADEASIDRTAAESNRKASEVDRTAAAADRIAAAKARQEMEAAQAVTLTPSVTPTASPAVPPSSSPVQPEGAIAVPVEPSAGGSDSKSVQDAPTTTPTIQAQPIPEK